MSKTLILMRHAKSAWDDPLMDDHDRPLNARGQRSAEALGLWLAGKGYLPDQVLSSDAARTRGTWAGLSSAFDPPETVVWTRDLYLAGSEGILRVLRQAKGECVLLLGHNEGIGDAASRLVRSEPQHPRFLDYPTAATTVMRFEIDTWTDLAWGTGEVLDFIVPRDLGIG